MANYETSVWVVKEQTNTEKNTSTVTVAFGFRRIDASYWGYNKANQAYWNITVDGQSSGNIYFNFDWNIGKNVWKEIGRKTFTIAHNNDGTKQISMKGYTYLGVSPSSLSANDTAALTTIPRETKITGLTNCVIGSSATVSVATAASSEFTHRFYYKIGGSKWYEPAEYTFTPSMDLCSQLPDSASGTIQLCLETYKASTLIGTHYKDYPCSVPESVVPEIGSVVITDTVKEVHDKFGAMVQSKSKPNIKTDAKGCYGSTVKEILVSIADTSYKGSDVNIEDLNVYGNIAVRVMVTDSRGRSVTQDKIVDIAEYHEKMIVDFDAVRCDNAGVVDEEDGDSLLIKLNYAISDVLGLNDKQYVIEIKKPSEDTWTRLYSNSSYYVFNNNILLKNVVDVDYEWVIRITLTDAFGAISAEQFIPTAYTILDINKSGRGMAFGKVSQKDEMEINDVVDFLKDVKIKGVNWLEVIYPIGSIYMSVSDVSPTTLFGGKWERFAQGQVLVGVDGNDADFNTVEKTGGEKSHKLTVEEMPAHSHPIGLDATGDGGNGVRGTRWYSYEYRTSTYKTGGDQAHNNMQPYVTVYIWKRTA